MTALQLAALVSFGLNLFAAGVVVGRAIDHEHLTDGTVTALVYCLTSAALAAYVVVR